MNELALFAGAGGGILGGKLLGWKTVCAVEFDEHARNVLIARQNDRSLEPFPIWDDVRTFDGKPWRGLVDVVSGGFPCQDISAAGTGKGLNGERSGLWSEMSRIIREVRPRFAFVENSPMLTVRGLGRVLGDLAEMGYNARWGVLGAFHASLPHVRERIWIIADSSEERRGGIFGGADSDSRDMERHFQAITSAHRPLEEFQRQRNEWQDKTEDSLPSYLCRVDDGASLNVDRLERVGNMQSPLVVAKAWEIMTGAIKAGALHYSLQQTHGGQSVSQPAPNCLTATSPC